MEQQLKNIAQQFAIQGEIADIRPLGNGLINTTYAVVTTGNPRLCAPKRQCRHLPRH